VDPNFCVVILTITTETNFDYVCRIAFIGASRATKQRRESIRELLMPQSDADTSDRSMRSAPASRHAGPGAESAGVDDGELLINVLLSEALNNPDEVAPQAACPNAPSAQSASRGLAARAAGLACAHPVPGHLCAPPLRGASASRPQLPNCVRRRRWRPGRLRQTLAGMHRPRRPGQVCGLAPKGPQTCVCATMLLTLMQ